MIPPHTSGSNEPDSQLYRSVCGGSAFLCLQIISIGTSWWFNCLWPIHKFNFLTSHCWLYAISSIQITTNTFLNLFYFYTPWNSHWIRCRYIHSSQVHHRYHFQWRLLFLLEDWASRQKILSSDDEQARTRNLRIRHPLSRQHRAAWREGFLIHCPRKYKYLATKQWSRHYHQYPLWP